MMKQKSTKQEILVKSEYPDNDSERFKFHSLPISICIEYPAASFLQLFTYACLTPIRNGFWMNLQCSPHYRHFRTPYCGLRCFRVKAGTLEQPAPQKPRVNWTRCGLEPNGPAMYKRIFLGIRNQSAPAALGVLTLRRFWAPCDAFVKCASGDLTFVVGSS